LSLLRLILFAGLSGTRACGEPEVIGKSIEFGV
jgi:hypothetical protein